MNYAGDIPPTPEERASLRLAANDAWLARSKERHAREGDPQYTLRDGRVKTGSQLDSEMMERDNGKALAAARKAIEGERKAHKCYICGRRDLPRYARWFGLWAAGFLAVWLYTSDTKLSNDAALFGCLGLVAIGATFGAAMNESIKPDDEQDLRRKFNETSHG
jgi:hypothetical protein